ncbi:MAG: beta strand repeat-containing protein, partial [Cytophagales bacterium]
MSFNYAHSIATYAQPVKKEPFFSKTMQTISAKQTRSLPFFNICKNRGRFAAIILLLLSLLLVEKSWGQVSMSSSSSITQNFNGLINSSSATFSDNSTISNWYSQRTGSGTTYAADAGSGNSGGLYSYGTGTNVERALGTIGSGNAAAGSFAHGVLLRNTSGNVITSITISYTLEQWRNGGNTTPNVVSFYYKTSSLNITALNPNVNTTWTSVSALNLSSPINTASASALDGNNASNKVTVSNISIPSLSLANNDYIMLKWEDPDHAGSDHGLAIDDVTISWTTSVPCTPPTVSATGLSLTPSATNMNVSWTNPPSGADGVIVVASSVAGFVAPSSGTAYTQNAVYGSGANLTNGNFVVFTGAGSSVNVTGLQSATPYYFAVYTYSASGVCYNTIDVLTATGSTLFDGGTFWDGDGSTSAACGGNGTWSTSSTTFSVDASCSSSGYIQTTGLLSFGSTAGAVQVSGTVSANNGLKFSTTGYTISNGTGINLGGAAALLNTITTDPSVTALISSTLNVSNGMTKAGTGTLSLAGTNTNSGSTIISAGTLYAASSSAFGTSAVSISNGNLLVGSSTNIANAITVNSAVSSSAYAVNYDFATASASTVTGSGYSVSAISQGNNFGTTPLTNNTSASSGYAGATGGNNAGAAARAGVLTIAGNGSAYFEFTLTPSVGTVNLTSLQFGSRSTNTGPQAYSLRSSSDGYASDIATGALANNSTWVLTIPSLITTVTSSIATAITFRIYGYNGSGNPGMGTANWRIDDLSFGGNVVVSTSAPSVMGSDITSGTATYSGDITLNDNVTLTSALGGTVSISGNFLNGSGTPTVTKVGTGTVQLSGTNTYQGTTTINGGTLILSRTGGGTLPSTNSIIVNAGGTLIINSNQTLNTLIVNAGGILIISDGVTLTVTQPLQISGTINLNATGLITSSPSTTFTLNAGATLVTGNINGVASSVGTFSSATYTSGANYIFSGTSAQSTGFTGLTLNTPGNIIISNTNVTSGVTLDANINSSGIVSVSGSSILTMPASNSITKSGSGVVSVAGTIKTANALGFSDASANASFIGYSATDFNLVSGSTVEYIGSAQPITNQVNYQNLILSGAGTITANSGTNAVAGNFTNNLSTGIFQNNNGTVSLTGTNQTISGTAATDFYNLNIGNGSTVTLNSAQRVSNTLSLGTTSTLNANGNLTIVSTFTSTARVGEIPSSATITGNVNVQR